eukprot:8643690-Pyramimonas_sp.AAC.1
MEESLRIPSGSSVLGIWRKCRAEAPHVRERVWGKSLEREPEPPVEIEPPATDVAVGLLGRRSRRGRLERGAHPLWAPHL